MADSDQIKVVVRIRPLIQREQQACLEARWNVKDEKIISQSDQPNLPPYMFDHVYDRDCTTWALYSGVIDPIVDAAMNGYHGTVFAYGQSGSGKTYTMSGDKMTPGVISQAMADIFEFIEQKPSHEFLMRASYMEIYNEKICDLLSKEDKHLKITETPDHQINVAGLEEVMVHSCENVLSVIQKGETNRKFAETKQNDRSSRSHCIFRIIIESRKRNEIDTAVMVSHLNFVDLAGSEKAGENSGDRFREGCSINMSLFTLSHVISKLSEGIANQFIGYRNSKLTRILQNALGGNSKTVIVATINPTAVEESHSTLRFATRAKTIKNKPHVNEVLSDAAMLKKYRNQISELEKIVKEMGVADIQSANEDLKKKLEEKQSLIEQLAKQIVVSSLPDKPSTAQKKKMRRETWAAPKVRRKSYFPSPSFGPHSSVTIREETDQDLELTRNEDLSLPFTTIDVCPNDVSKTKAFLRRSDERALSESLLSVPAEDKEGARFLPPEGREAEGEVERLEELVQVMEASHAQEVDRLQERIKQLEYEKAMELDLQEERDKADSGHQDRLTGLQEKLDHMQYQCQLHVEENQLLQTNLWHAEESIKRLNEETGHLCDKRFDFSLKDWEELQAAKTSLEAEKKQLEAAQHQKDKELEDLQKALSEQEPYIARLQQQLETFMGSGQLGSGGGRRRSGIPVLLKSEGKDSPNRVEAGETDYSTASESTAAHTPWPLMVDCGTSTDDLQAASPTQIPKAVVSPQKPAQCESELPTGSSKNLTTATTPQEQPDQDLKEPKQYQNTEPANVSVVPDVCNVSVSFSTKEEVFCSQVGGSPRPDTKKENETVTPERSAVMPVPRTVESSTKRATQLKRRSDGVVAAISEEDSSELNSRLREKDNQLENAIVENKRLLEVLNQANTEIVRYKEAMEAMEQADAERMEELSELPKLRTLLNRREMEIHRLESMNDRLKEEINQQMLNSSMSSLSSSFTEPRRKSVMLKEREAEIWKLKDKLLQQAKYLDDVQQEKDQLENIVQDLQNQPVTEADQGCLADDISAHSSCSAPCTSPPSHEMNTSQKEEEDVETEPEQVMVTMAEMEAVQKALSNKDSCISHLKTQLQEKEEEMDQLFEGRMLVSSDMIQTHLQQAEDQKSRIEELEGQVTSYEEEVARLRAQNEVQRRSSSNSSSGSNQSEDSVFIEKLCMDNMSLEENLQEKLSELSQIAEQNEALRAQLDERRDLINELRQKYEDATDALLSTQEELIAFKRLKDNEEANNMASTQQAYDQEALPMSKGEEDPLEGEVSLSTAPAKSSEQLPDKEPLTLNEDGDSFEVSFKTARTQVHNSDGADPSKHCAGDPFQSQELEDSFEVSFKTTAEGDLAQRLQSSEEREVELLEMLREKEEEIQSLRSLPDQTLLSCAAETGHDDTHPTTDVKMDSSDVNFKEQCNILMEQKKSLENKLEDAEAALEEKSILETKVQELLKVVDEKSSVISQLQKRSEETGSQVEKSLLADNSESISHETWSAEKEALVAKLNHLSHVEECLENNIKMLEQSQEEKAALDGQVKDLESRLEQLSQTAENKDTEKESLVTQIEKETSELESLRSQNEHIVSQKTELEHEVQDLKTKEKTLTKELQRAEEAKIQLVESLEQCAMLETKAMELAAKNEELTNTLEQMASEQVELNTELTWQTKENEKLQKRVDELESEQEEQKQEAEDLVRELEDTKKMVDDSEQCQQVVEDTLANFKEQNSKLEEEKHVLATERDEYELRMEAAVKEQEHLRLELSVTTDRLQDRVSALEMELQTMEKRKEVLEAALADKESTQRMGELLHEKLSVDLQESQAEVATVKSALSQLQFELQSQESKLHTLNKITANLEAEKDRLEVDKSSLEKEKLELKDRLSAVEEEVRALQRDLDNKRAVEQSKWALESEVQGRRSEVDRLQGDLQRLQRGAEADRKLSTQLQAERDQARVTCQELSHTVARLESRCAQADHQCQQLTLAMQQLKQSKEEDDQSMASKRSECSRLQDELGSKLELIEHLQKEIETTKASSSAGEKTVPLLEYRKQKFVLRKEIAGLREEVDTLKKDLDTKDLSIKELEDKLAVYETEEQEDKNEKIRKLEGDLMAKNFELVGINQKHESDINKLHRQISQAEEMVAYKEQIIGKLKGEIRRIQSEEPSFCSSGPPKAKAPAAPAPVTAVKEERVSSSHSGIIDRYTVTILEADKYKLQKELKKTQERLKSRESELHWTKVALAKTRSGDALSPPSPASSAGSATRPSSGAGHSGTEQKPASALQRGPGSGTLREQLSPPSQRLGTSVDGGVTPCEPVSRGAGDSTPSVAADTAAIRSGFMSGGRAPVRAVDSVSRPWKPEVTGVLQSSVSAGGSSVDVKKDRPVLPSTGDKENTPFGSDVLGAHKPPADATMQAATDVDSPINMEPGFWKKRQQSQSVLKSSLKRQQGKSPTSEADQCKAQ